MIAFITVTHVILCYDGSTEKLPGLRLQISHIVGYMPHSQGGAVIQTSDHESYRVAESVEQLDRAIDDVSDNYTGLNR